MTRKEAILNDPQVVEPPAGFKGNVALKVKCCKCDKTLTVNLTNYWKRRKNGPWSCYECRKPGLAEQAKNNPIYRNPKYRAKFRKLHRDPTYREKVHNRDVYDKISASSKQVWRDGEKREHHSRHRRTKEFKNRVAKWAKKQWRDEEYVQRQRELRSSSKYVAEASQRSKKLWQNPEYREKMIEVLNKARPNSAPKEKISSLQKILYSILRNMNIPFFEEGPDTVVHTPTASKDFKGYSFDCKVPLVSGDLFIECHGEYWHGPDQEAADRAKATFLMKYFPTAQLLVLWEFEFRSPERIKTMLSEKLGIKKVKPVDFVFDDVIIKRIKEVSDDVRSLFAIHHYLANIGRFGSLRYGGYLADELVIAAVFSSPTRQESAAKLGLRSRELLELSRFCINKKHQKKNFATWFLSRVVKMLWCDKPLVKKIITFADTTHGHDGTIYKAANWVFTGETKPDYWYIDEHGSRFHKKTIWDHASKMSQGEFTYAEQRGLSRILGGKKLRFVIDRPTS
ncbi:MAG: hypothetical protein Q8K86_00260 [Candidatus Nanopelagicaceae bacterium]|nr:hypothetical protein [Candidatus Nanopelagicaceae bacterium]